ncbi:MAG: protein kinase [Nitrospirota bacterium]|nr:protein kinase [Nitrospirota bacterium]MDH5586514.1 protein kinase [Nitrospirota bacterium]
MQTLQSKQLFAGKFEVQGEISKGQTGTIYYGYDIGLCQEVAIKIYHSHINGRVIRGKAFIEKSKPLLLIDHPNLIKIFKVEEEDDTPVIFMEFFDAPSLQQIIREKGPLSVQDMLILTREIAEVLVHTHFQGIIHGTLHPGHVLVGPQGQIKVMDLGLSWILMDILSNCDEEVLRPLPYFPPEIAKGELLTVSSDLYSLGFMMYEMLTSTVPYVGLPKTSIMGKLAFDQTDPEFQFLDTVPEAICDLIRHMTRNKAQERLQDATHVLTIINQQLSKLPLDKKSAFLPSATTHVQAPPPTNPAEAKKPLAEPPTHTPGSNQEELATKQPPPIQRSQKQIHHHKNTHTNIARKIGITMGLVILLGIAGAIGYWYRDLLQPHISVLQAQPENSEPQTNFPRPLPTEPGGAIPLVSQTPDFQKPIGDTGTPPKTNPPTLITPQPKDIFPSTNVTSPLRKPEKQSEQATLPATPSHSPMRQETPALSKINPTAPRAAEKPPVDSKPAIQAISPESDRQPLPISSSPKAADSEPPQPLTNPISVPTAAAPSTEKNPQEPTDKEIDELLQGLNIPPIITPPSPTAP